MNNQEYILKSSLGWIDFSDEDKGKVMKVIEMLGDAGTIDELGVGVIRNSLSDAMFNGITTIQTRAKYFFIVPRILHQYTTLKSKPTSAIKYLYDEETKIMNELTWALDDPNNQGIIGYTVSLKNKNIPPRRWKQVVTKPSAIYWNGIRTFGLISTQLSLANFLNVLENGQHDYGQLGYNNGEGEKGDDKDTERNINHVFNFSMKKNWSQNLTINLSSEEANILKHKIIDAQKDQLIGLVLKNEKWIKQFLDAKNFKEMTLKPFINELPDKTKAIIHMAKDFWNILYGAHIRYNVILQGKYGRDKKRLEYESKWDEWNGEMHMFQWNHFDRDLMWSTTEQHSTVKRRTKSFVNSWMDGLINNEPISYMDNLVEKQEKDNKGSRAKLRDSNDQYYKDWEGFNRMEFRFGNAQLIIRDIALGLSIIDD